MLVLWRYNTLYIVYMLSIGCLLFFVIVMLLFFMQFISFSSIMIFPPYYVSLSFDHAFCKEPNRMFHMHECFYAHSKKPRIYMKEDGWFKALRYSVTPESFACMKLSQISRRVHICESMLLNMGINTLIMLFAKVSCRENGHQ